MCREIAGWNRYQDEQLGGPVRRNTAFDRQHRDTGAEEYRRTSNSVGAVFAIATAVAPALPGSTGISHHRHLNAHFGRLHSGQSHTQGQEDPENQRKDLPWRPVLHYRNIAGTSSPGKNIQFTSTQPTAVCRPAHKAFQPGVKISPSARVSQNSPYRRSWRRAVARTGSKPACFSGRGPIDGSRLDLINPSHCRRMPPDSDRKLGDNGHDLSFRSSGDWSVIPNLNRTVCDRIVQVPSKYDFGTSVSCGRIEGRIVPWENGAKISSGKFR